MQFDWSQTHRCLDAMQTCPRTAASTEKGNKSPRALLLSSLVKFLSKFAERSKKALKEKHFSDFRATCVPKREWPEEVFDLYRLLLPQVGTLRPSHLVAHSVDKNLPDPCGSWTDASTISRRLSWPKPCLPLPTFQKKVRLARSLSTGKAVRPEPRQGTLQR